MGQNRAQKHRAAISPASLASRAPSLFGAFHAGLWLSDWLLRDGLQRGALGPGSHSLCHQVVWRPSSASWKLSRHSSDQAQPTTASVCPSIPAQEGEFILSPSIAKLRPLWRAHRGCQERFPRGGGKRLGWPRSPPLSVLSLGSVAHTVPTCPTSKGLGQGWHRGTQGVAS